MLMNYHIGRLVLSSLCVGAFVAAGIWLVFVLQASVTSSWSFIQLLNFISDKSLLP